MINVVNYTKFAVLTTMLSGQQPGNKNSRIPGSWPGTRVVTRYPFRALIICICHYAPTCSYHLRAEEGEGMVTTVKCKLRLNASKILVPRPCT